MKANKPKKIKVTKSYLPILIILAASIVSILLIYFQQLTIIKQKSEINELKSSIGWISSKDDINSKTFSIDDAEMIMLINSERTKNGLSELINNPILSQAACMKAEDMIAKKYWSHNAPDGTQPWYFFDQVSYSYIRAGENLAHGQYTSAAVVSGWVASPKHYANIIGNYEETGICHKVARYQGGTSTLIVNLFGTRR